MLAGMNFCFQQAGCNVCGSSPVPLKAKMHSVPPFDGLKALSLPTGRDETVFGVFRPAVRSVLLLRSNGGVAGSLTHLDA
jgi:hypothetical protein